MLSILEETPQVEEIVGEKNVVFSGAKCLDFSNFSYGEEVILNDISLEFPKGAIIGIGLENLHF